MEKREERDEELAKLAHEQWSGWMRYMFRKCERRDDGTLIMPKWAVDRWTRQMNSAYSELSEHDRESDREEADRFLRVIQESKQWNAV